MENEKKFIIPKAEIIKLSDDIITTSGQDVKDFENPEVIPFI